MKNRVVKIIAYFLVLVIILCVLQRLLMPKYMSDIVEGTMVSEYYKEKDKDFDVLLIGDCEIYENICPQVLWDEYGINSCIRGSAQQLIWQSYYLMEESFKYHKPDAVVFNILSMKYNEPQKETYNRMTLDYMKWSPSKVKSIRASMLPEEDFVTYLFPILRYHSRWNELKGEDLKYIFKRDNVTFNGYYMRVDVKAAEDVPEGRPLPDYQFGENAYKYLDMMKDLCDENGVELILIKAPSLYPYWYKQWDQQMVDYAKNNNLKYYNFLDVTDEIGLDFNEDTYDGGLHLNYSGAKKLSTYFGNLLSKEHGIKDKRSDKNLVNYWDNNRKALEAEKKRQESGL